MEEHVSESYIRRCHKALRAMDAPLEGWFCTDVDDYEDDSFTCELCGCRKVRFVHRMEHCNFPDPILVGCICAGIMEGNIIAAQERERLVRNRAHRRDHFVRDGYDEDHGIHCIHSRKLDALEDLIEAANGKPVLVAYWFKHDLARIMQRFPYAREIKTSVDIVDWNAGRIPVAVIHPASAGHGLNLQAGGSTLVWYGLTWSLELYQQTNARLWRQGQTSATVIIHHIVTAGTIDENILSALKQKNKTQSALIDAVKAHLKREA